MMMTMRKVVEEIHTYLHANGMITFNADKEVEFLEFGGIAGQEIVLLQWRRTKNLTR